MKCVLKRNDPLRAMYRASNEIRDTDITFDTVTYNPSEGCNYYYFTVKGQSLIISLVKHNNVWVKNFKCSCIGASLWGQERNTPCKHIIKLVEWLNDYCNNNFTVIKKEVSKFI